MLLNMALIAVVGLVTNTRFLTSDPKNVAARAKLISYFVLAHPRNHLSGWASHSVNNSNLKSKCKKRVKKKNVNVFYAIFLLLYCQKPFIIKRISCLEFNSIEKWISKLLSGMTNNWKFALLRLYLSTFVPFIYRKKIFFKCASHF